MMRKLFTGSRQLKGSLRQFFYFGGVNTEVDFSLWPAGAFVNVFKPHKVSCKGKETFLALFRSSTLEHFQATHYV